MGRPRKVSDDQLLAACVAAIGLYGPKFTLAHVAGQAGVATATVAERFGSKHALLMALLAADNQTLRERMLAAAASAADPVAAIEAAVLEVSGGADDPETAVAHLAQFGADLNDPKLRAGVAEQRAVVRGVLAELVSAAKLKTAPETSRAAAVLTALAYGSQLDWALSPDGPLAARIHDDLTAVLDGWSR